ncbi:MAG: hypothetical protein K1X50_13850 [Candidatus Promineofilum sp.]|mgnify:CR=1 FL=1|nr:hypothetical protein [Promineifilum sp.]MCW5864151.1 PD40 domain-containing protein [Anaerolineae bacterium]
MRSNFDWQTEDDDRREHSGWDEPAETRPAAPRRRPPWRLLGLIGGLLLAVGALIWWRVDKRIEATTQAMRTDVVASHNLVQRAVADGDAEVFRASLSGRDPAWTEGTLAVFESGLFADRAPFGLSPVAGSLPVVLPAPDEEAAADQRPAAIELSADLNQAIVTVDQPYRGDDGSTVLLQQTTIFRRGDRRWLLAPPLGDFWGEWQTHEGDYLNLIYPGRDAVIAEQLAVDFDAAIAGMCATLADIDCSADLFLTVRLDTEPQTLADLSQPIGALRRARQNGNILELPAPSLVGLPAGDEGERKAAYAALRDGYTRHVLGAAIAQAVSWRCCDASLLFSMLLQYQLSDLGLVAAPPVGPDDYRRVLDNSIPMRRLNLLTNERLPEEIEESRLWLARLAVDFLLQSGDLSAADLQRRLTNLRSFDQFAQRALEDGAGGRPVPVDLTQALWLYALQRSAGAETEAPLPDETLYLVCTAPGESEAPETSQLLRYAPATDSWKNIYSMQGFIWMTPLPDRETMLLQEFVADTETWRTRFWRDGEVAEAYRNDLAGSAASLGQTDPTGTQLLIYHYNPENKQTHALAVDLTSCSGRCAVQALPGLPTWSPDGHWALYLGDGNGYPTQQLVANDRHILLDTTDPFSVDRLTLVNQDDPAVSATNLGRGYAPFWLDERTFGFIRQLDDVPASRADEAIVIATIDDPNPQTLILGADLYQFLPDDQQMRQMDLAYVAANPRQPDRLFIVARDQVGEDAYVFLYDRTTGRSELRLTLGADYNHSLGFSPDGRYLVMTGVGYTSNSDARDLAPLLLHDIDANRTIPLLARSPYFLPSVVYDWTPDGRLVVALDDNLLGVVIPDTGQVRLLRHNAGACTSVAWLDE